MQFHDIENHDDFYSFDKSHDDVNSTIWKCAVTSAKAYSPHSTNVTPHVQDYRGFYIVYDAALQDLENLTDELLMLASHYIEKDESNFYYCLSFAFYIRNSFVERVIRDA